jgi:hypothetical protein
MWGWIKLWWCVAFHDRYLIFPSSRAVVCRKCGRKWLEE